MAVEPTKRVVEVPIVRRDEKAAQQERNKRQKNKDEEKQKKEVPQKSGKVDITV